jgi:predicted HD phosphohydrolase
MGAFSQLTSYKLNRETGEAQHVYFVQHSSRTVRYENRSGGILEQDLIITGNPFQLQFVADMKFEDFPKCSSEREAALRLASWMQRMSAAIEDYWSQP